MVAPLDLVSFPLQAEQQIFKVCGGGDQPVNGCFQLRLVAGLGLGRLMLNVALALVLTGDDDGQSMLLTNTVAGAADIVIFCPKCKKEVRIDVVQLKMVLSK